MKKKTYKSTPPNLNNNDLSATFLLGCSEIDDAHEELYILLKNPRRVGVSENIDLDQHISLFIQKFAKHLEVERNLIFKLGNKDFDRTNDTLNKLKALSKENPENLKDECLFQLANHMIKTDFELRDFIEGQNTKENS